MSLGGYKFAGKYCEKGSLTDVQWALLMHKTRLAAFMASNALSSAGWSFDQTGGDIAFGTYGNVIYSLDSVGNNYVSFMKHGTDNPAYIAIITTCYWGTTSQSNVGEIDGPWLLKFGADPYIGACNSMYHRLSRVQLTTSNLFSDVTGASPLIPLGFVMSTAASYSGMTPSQSYSFPAQSAFYAGYAIKDELAIAFAARTVSSQKAIHFSALGVGARTHVIPSTNTNDIVASSPFGAYFGSSGAVNYGDSIDIDGESNDSYQYGATFIIDSSGGPQVAAIVCPNFAQFVTTVSPQVYPFGTIALVAKEEQNSIYKGSVAIDFISSNVCPVKQTDRLGVYAGGNYLFVGTVNYTQSFPATQYAFTTYQTVLGSAPVSGYPALYVGWDPSNPDITQASAWQLYDGT